MSNRPARRTLVRWNDDHDKELLMWMVYCSAEQGLKLPWARIAQCMGPSFTEGACTQHLAKIRTRMEQEGLHVPPPQKRGTATKTGSSIYRPKKLKDANDPVPRIRPEIDPPPQHELDSYAIDDEEEEEVEEHMDVGRTARKTVRQQSSLVVKEDSSEDEPMPTLYDSDNEYGAKKAQPDSAKKNSGRTAQKIQMQLNFGGQSAGQVAAGYQTNPDGMSSMQNSPGLKIESIEDDAADTFVPPAPPKQQGIRRKSSAMTVDDEDDEYEPEVRGRGRAKKSKGNRNTKRSKASDKNKADSEKNSSTDRAGYSEAAAYDADRIAMPPPPLPYPNNSATGFGWNTNFMQQPFMGSSGANFSSSDYDSPYGHHSPTSNHVDNFGFGPSTGSGNRTFSTYQRPSLDYLTSGLVPNTSAPSTRNHSFTSIASTSTAENASGSWTQPMRSPSFPNPQEATQALHRALNAPEANTSTHVNMFRSPYQGADVAAPWASESYTTLSNQEVDDHMYATGADSGDLFFEPPPELLSDEFLASLTADRAYD